jgi:mRNA interferase YafQ
MRDVVLTSAFKKDYKRLNRSGQYQMQYLQDIVAKLANDNILDDKYRDHALIRTGSHSDLF